jgi:hypothetical protein
MTKTVEIHIPNENRIIVCTEGSLENKLYELGKEQGKLDQSFLSTDKNLGKNELNIAIDEAIDHIQKERETCDRVCCAECGRRDIALSVFKRLKSQIKKEGEKR